MYHFRGEQGYDAADRRVKNARQREPRRRDPRDRRQTSVEPGSRDGNRYRPDQRRFPYHSQPRISNRPLLRSTHDSQGEQMFGDQAAQARFRNVDELTDSEEDVMDLSDNANDADEPKSKRARLDTVAEAEDPAPKWSNPNPYTSLPPPAESTGKKLDFVKLIRKARIAPGAKNGHATAANDDNFISFDQGEESDSSIKSSSFLKHVEDVLDTVSATFLGKRKRDESPVARAIQKELGDPAFHDGMIVRQWVCLPDANPTPWVNQSKFCNDPGLALHKEIVDFYEWVKPQDYEVAVRADAFARLDKELNMIELGDLKAFGSNAAGLFLPVGDLDLVFIQKSRRGQGTHGLLPPTSKGLIRRVAEGLRRRGVAENGSIQLILHAKVPLIKFVDQKSGLKVDLSFNNETGPQAIETFSKWKNAYPTMPIIVSVIKQFLMLRGLNDVSTGGLGGFSIICLVTSLYQHLPLTTQPPNLGQILVEFFNLYGNLIDHRTVAIRLEPPGYVDKTSYLPNLIIRDKQDRLTIIDPNRPDNNISGGTHKINAILKCFSRAYDVLQARMAVHADSSSSTQPSSFLRGLIGGNFEAYYKQRNRLHFLHFGRHLQRELVLTPVTQLNHASHSNPHVAVPSTENGTQKNGKTTHVSKALAQLSLTAKPGARRAQRLKLARPDIASKIGNTIPISRAVKLGKYKDGNEMAADVEAKLAALTKAQKKPAPTSKKKA